jgi:hypothetical protein
MTITDGVWQCDADHEKPLCPRNGAKTSCLGQLCDIRRNPPRLIFRKQLGGHRRGGKRRVVTKYTPSRAAV